MTTPRGLPFVAIQIVDNKVFGPFSTRPYRRVSPPVAFPLYASVRSNLPTIQHFFGRDTELAKLLPDLHPDATGWGALIDGLAIRAAELAAPGHFDEIVFLSDKQTAMDSTRKDN